MDCWSLLHFASKSKKLQILLGVNVEMVFAMTGAQNNSPVAEFVGFRCAFVHAVATNGWSGLERRNCCSNKVIRAEIQTVCAFYGTVCDGTLENRTIDKAIAYSQDNPIPPTRRTHKAATAKDRIINNLLWSKSAMMSSVNWVHICVRMCSKTF